MKRIRVIIADDELPALNLLESYVKQFPMLELVGRCGNAEEVIKRIAETDVDLLFLDIQMPGMSGIELSKRLASHHKVIFTTAFPNYALEGYKVEAVDYLLKPFDLEEFSSALKKAEKRILLEQSRTSIDAFFVKTEHRLERIRFEDLLLIESDRDYVKLFIEGQNKPITTLLKIKDLEEQLPQNQFMRVHRSFIVNLTKIDRIERNQILVGDKRITIAESYRAHFQTYIQKHIL